MWVDTLARGSKTNVTLFTKVNMNYGTSFAGRGNRGLDIDSKEFMAFRNTVHFNFKNELAKFKSTNSSPVSKEDCLLSPRCVDTDRHHVPEKS